jgi:hypothetical protein
MAVSAMQVWPQEDPTDREYIRIERRQSAGFFEQELGGAEGQKFRVQSLGLGIVPFDRCLMYNSSQEILSAIVAREELVRDRPR